MFQVWLTPELPMREVAGIVSCAWLMIVVGDAMSEIVMVIWAFAVKAATNNAERNSKDLFM
jgi:hypothetical protein